MAEKIDEQTWGAGLTKRISERIRGARIANGMSAQDLADRTAVLGHPVTRQVIANLEGHRKRNIALDDLFVIAHALEISPLVLVFDPFAQGAPFEVLPGLVVPEWEALQWVRLIPGVVSSLYSDDFDSARGLFHLRSELERARRDSRWTLQELDYLETNRRLIGGSPLTDEQVASSATELRRRLEVLERTMRAHEASLRMDRVDLDTSWFEEGSIAEYRRRVFSDDWDEPAHSSEAHDG